MKLYLAGPMRGYPANNATAFAEAAARLRVLGHEVWSPSEHDATVDVSQATMRDFMQRDLAALLQQEGIVLLDGWPRSHGACLERHAADVCGMPVFMFDEKVGLIPLAGHDWRWRSGPVSAR